jgi:hypothetical protein
VICIWDTYFPWARNLLAFAWANLAFHPHGVDKLVPASAMYSALWSFGRCKSRYIKMKRKGAWVLHVKLIMLLRALRLKFTTITITTIWFQSNEDLTEEAKHTIGLTNKRVITMSNVIFLKWLNKSINKRLKDSLRNRGAQGLWHCVNAWLVTVFPYTTLTVYIFKTLITLKRWLQLWV